MSINTVLNGNTANSPSCPWTLRSNQPGSLDIFPNDRYIGREAVREITSANGTRVWFVVTGTSVARPLSFTLIKADGTTQEIPISQAGRMLIMELNGQAFVIGEVQGS